MNFSGSIRLRRIALAAACCCCVGVSPPLLASNCDSQVPPHEVVETVTQDVLKVLDEATEEAQNLESIYTQLESIVLPFFDLDGFLRGVMGYRGKAPAAEEARRVRHLESFREVFKKSLVSTYGKGLVVFGGGSSSVVPADEATRRKIRTGGRVVVEQHIHSQGHSDYIIQYRMQPHAETCHWLSGNLMVQGVNLGKVYRSQFSSALERHNGDVERVIAGWGRTEPAVGTEPTAGAAPRGR